MAKTEQQQKPKLTEFQKGYKTAMKESQAFIISVKQQTELATLKQVYDKLTKEGVIATCKWLNAEIKKLEVLGK